MKGLHLAAAQGDAAAVRRLAREVRSRLEASLHNIKDIGEEYALDGSYGVTALMVAAALGRDAVVRELLTLGADRERQDAAGMTAVYFACQYDQPATLNILIDAGAAVDGACHATWIRPLAWAALHASLECVKLLLTRGRGKIDVNAQDAKGATALHHAALKRYPQMVAALLAAGADPNVRDNRGHTPLDEARDDFFDVLIDDAETEATIALLEGAFEGNDDETVVMGYNNAQ